MSTLLQSLDENFEIGLSNIESNDLFQKNYELFCRDSLSVENYKELILKTMKEIYNIIKNKIDSNVVIINEFN